MISKLTVTRLAERIANDKKDVVVNKIGNALKSSLERERISSKRINRILDNFLIELDKNGQ